MNLILDSKYCLAKFDHVCHPQVQHPDSCHPILMTEMNYDAEINGLRKRGYKMGDVGHRFP